LFIVGFADVDQQTPLPVMDAPPLVKTLPPETAVVDVIEVIAVVVRVGTTIWLVVKETSFP
jgi:hypothetical protein